MNNPTDANTDSAVMSGTDSPCTAMLLAAGRGERMRPLTDNTAKPLLMANGKRLIEYHLEKFANAGITHTVINTSWCAEKVSSSLGNGQHFGLHIDYSHEPTALETAGGIRNALPLLGDNPFLVVSADVWCDVDFGCLISRLPDRGAHLLMANNPAHNPGGDFVIDSNNTLQLKSDTDNSHDTDTRTVTYTGIGLYHPALFKSLQIAPYPLRDVLIPAIQDGKVSAEIHQGLWFDIGTIERLQALDSLLRGQHSSDHSVCAGNSSSN